MKRILPIALAAFVFIMPVSAYTAVSRTDGGSAEATVFLDSDAGSYKAGFSSNEIHAWSDSVQEITRTIRNISSGSAADYISNPGYVYWKIRSTGNYSIYLFRSSALVSDDASQSIPWTAEVASLTSSGDDAGWITIAANENPSENIGDATPVFERNFNGVMDTAVNSLPLRIKVGPVGDISGGEFVGTLTLVMKENS